MEAQIESGGGSPAGGVMAMGAGSGGPAHRAKQQQQKQQQGIQEVLAHSALHISKYQQIREDYNRLLYK